MTLKQLLNRLIREVENDEAKGIDTDEKYENMVKTLIEHIPYSDELSGRIGDYIETKQIVFDSESDNPVKYDYNNMLPESTVKVGFKHKVKGFALGALKAIRTCVRNHEISNENKPEYKVISDTFYTRGCHETDSFNDLPAVENYLDEVIEFSAFEEDEDLSEYSQEVIDTKNRHGLDRKNVDELINYVGENYTYNDKELGDANALYKPLQNDNTFEQSKAELEAQFEEFGPSDDYKNVVISKEAQAKFNEMYDLTDEYFNTFGYSTDLATYKLYNERRKINDLFTNIANINADDLNDRVKEVNDYIKSNEPVGNIIKTLDDNFNKDKYKEAVAPQDNIPLKYLKYPVGISKLNGLYCINKLIKRIGITKEQFISDPMAALRKYDEVTSATFVGNKKAKESMDSILPPLDIDKNYRDTIYNGALNFIITLDQKNMANNQLALVNENAKRHLREANPIYKVKQTKGASYSQILGSKKSSPNNSFINNIEPDDNIIIPNLDKNKNVVTRVMEDIYGDDFEEDQKKTTNNVNDIIENIDENIIDTSSKKKEEVIENIYNEIKLNVDNFKYDRIERPKLKEKRKKSNPDEDNLNTYRNILLAKDDTDLKDIVVGSYYDSDKLEVVRNEELYSKKVMREFQEEVSKWEEDHSYQIDKTKVPSINEVIQNFETMKQKIYQKYKVTDPNTSQKNIQTAKDELKNLMAATIMCVKDIKMISSTNPELKAEFNANQTAVLLANDFTVYLNTLPNNELINTILFDTKVDYARLINSDPNSIVNDLESAELRNANQHDNSIADIVNLNNFYADEILKDDVPDAVKQQYKSFINSANKQIEVLQKEEVYRLANSYNNGKIPLNYFKERIKQIRLNEPIGNLDFNLNAIGRLQLAKHKYLIDTNVEEPYTDGEEIAEAELDREFNAVDFNFNEYDTKIIKNSYNLTTKKASEVLERITALENTKNGLDGVKKAEAEFEIKNLKISLLIGYLEGSTGVELDNKIDALTNPSLKTTMKALADHRRMIALQTKINDARLLRGEQLYEANNLNAAKEEAQRLNLNVDEIVNSVGFDYSVGVNDHSVDRIYQEFTTNPNLANVDIKLNNDGKIDLDNIRVYDGANKLDNILNLSKKNINLLRSLDTNFDRKEHYEFFLNNIQSINKHASRIQSEILKKIDDKLINEGAGRDGIKVLEEAEANLEYNQIDPHAYNYDELYGEQGKLDFDSNNKNGLYELYKLSNINLDQYSQKHQLLVNKLSELNRLAANVTKNTNQLNEYFDKIEEIHVLETELQIFDMKIANFANKSNEVTNNTELMPNANFVGYRSNKFVPNQFIGNAKLRSQLDAFKNIKRICQENDINPEDLFKENSKETINNLINKLADGVKHAYLVNEDDSLEDALGKLTFNNDQASYKNDRRYKDMLTVCDFVASMDGDKSKDNFIAANHIKNHFKREIGDVIKYVNFKDNSPYQTYSNLLARTNQNIKDIVFNNDYNEAHQQYYKNSANSYDMIFKAGDELTPVTMANNFNQIKNYIVSHADADRDRAKENLMILSKAYHDQLLAYFKKNPAKLNDRNYKTYKNYITSPKKLCDDAFRNFDTYPAELVENMKRDKDMYDDLYEIELNGIRATKEKHAFDINSKVYVANTTDAEKANFERILNETLVSLYRDAKMGTIPVSYYNDQVALIENIRNNNTVYTTREFTKDEENEIKRNIFFREKGVDLNIDIPFPNLVFEKELNDPFYIMGEFTSRNRSAEKKQIVVDLNRQNNINNIENEDNKNIDDIKIEDEKEIDNDSIIDTSSKQKFPVDINDNTINNEKSKKIENKVIEENIIIKEK